MGEDGQKKGCLQPSERLSYGKGMDLSLKQSKDHCRATRKPTLVHSVWGKSCDLEMSNNGEIALGIGNVEAKTSSCLLGYCYDSSSVVRG